VQEHMQLLSEKDASLTLEWKPYLYLYSGRALALVFNDF